MLKFGNIPDSTVGNEIVSSGGTVPTGQGAYQGLYDANPYVNQNYTKTPWQQFLSGLGFRTEADAWQENMGVQAAEYNALIAQKQYDEEYNLPINQIQRMKAAGLNPDISGGDGIDPGSAQNLGEDPSTPMQSTGASGTPAELMSFADSIMGIFSTSLGIAQGIQGVTRSRLENRMIGIQTEEGLNSLVQQLVPLFIPQNDSDFVSIDDEGNRTVGDWRQLAISQAESFIGSSLPKNIQSSVLDRITNFFNSATGDEAGYSKMKSSLESQFGYRVSHNTYEDEAYQILEIFAKELGDLNEEYMKAAAHADISQAEGSQAEGDYNKEYYTTLDGEVQAGAENAQANFNMTNFNMNERLNSHIGNIIDALDNASKQSGIKGGLASIAMALLSAFRLFITTQGLPSVSRSSSSGGSSWSRGSGSASHSSQSISIGF